LLSINIPADAANTNKTSSFTRQFSQIGFNFSLSFSLTLDVPSIRSEAGKQAVLADHELNFNQTQLKFYARKTTEAKTKKSELN